MKITWLLRGRTWRTFHVHRCLDCNRKFCDDEPGSWADYRYDQFPELCSTSCQRYTRHGAAATGPAAGPVGRSAPPVRSGSPDELIWLRKAYGD